MTSTRDAAPRARWCAVIGSILALGALGGCGPADTGADEETQSTERGISEPCWIGRLYADVLGRPADPGGQASWEQAVAGGMPLRDVALGFLRSDEARGNLVRSVYLGLLRREPDPGGFALTKQQLAAGKRLEEIVASFAASDEYFVGQAGSNRYQFVRMLYQDLLGRVPADSEVAGWASTNANLEGSAVARYGVALGFVGSPEYRNRVVGGYYARYLHRAADPGGLSTWTGALAAGWTVEDVQASLVTSDEYRQACAAAPPATCAPSPYARRPVDLGPIFVHYGPKEEAHPNRAIEDALLGTGEGETVLVTRALAPANGCGPNDDDFAYFRGKGGRWAYKLTTADLEHALDDGSFVSWFGQTIDAGWDYVAWDEARDEPAQHFENGSPHGEQLAAALAQLSANGNGRRFIAFFASSTQNAQSAKKLSHVLEAVHDHGRVVVLESYRHASTGWTTAQLVSLFDGHAKHVHGAVPGINDRVIIALGVANAGADPDLVYLDDHPHDLAFLQRELSALHQGSLTSKHPGFGTYAWTRVGDNASYSAVQLATKVRGLANWW